MSSGTRPGAGSAGGASLRLPPPPGGRGRDTLALGNWKQRTPDPASDQHCARLAILLPKTSLPRAPVSALSSTSTPSPLRVPSSPLSFPLPSSLRGPGLPPPPPLGLPACSGLRAWGSWGRSPVSGALARSRRLPLAHLGTRPRRSQLLPTQLSPAPWAGQPPACAPPGAPCAASRSGCGGGEPPPRPGGGSALPGAARHPSLASGSPPPAVPRPGPARPPPPAPGFPTRGSGAPGTQSLSSMRHRKESASRWVSQAGKRRHNDDQEIWSGGS